MLTEVRTGMVDEKIEDRLKVYLLVDSRHLVEKYYSRPSDILVKEAGGRI